MKATPAMSADDQPVFKGDPSPRITPEAIVVFRHTVVIDRSSSSCGNCSCDVMPNGNPHCPHCGTKFFFCLSTYSPEECCGEDLKGFAEQFERDFHHLVYIGVGSGAVYGSYGKIYEPRFVDPNAQPSRDDK